MMVGSMLHTLSSIASSSWAVACRRLGLSTRWPALRATLAPVVRGRGPELALVGVTMIWGFTFLIVHVAMREAGALSFVGLRFLCAAAAVTLVLRPRWRATTRQELLAGVSVGALIALGYGLQTAGLRHIDSSTSAFITAAYVPLVPLLQGLVWRRWPSWPVTAGCALAFIGLLLVAGPGASWQATGAGELMTLASALAIALEVLVIGFWAGRVDLRRMTVLQLASAGLLSLLAMPLAGERWAAPSPLWLSAAVGLGLASALIQWTMNWAQQWVAPARATVLYAAEPVWAGLIGWLAGERLGAGAIGGGGLIVAGVLVSSRAETQAPDVDRLGPPAAPVTVAERDSRLGP
jgi:drug/metabolite transporter (DMT)-like permease